MKKFFNTTGPCHPDKHYMIDPLTRLTDLHKLIDKELYFVVHAPRQSGKTTLLMALAKQITAEGKYAAMAFSCERGQPFGDNIEDAEKAVIESILQASRNTLPAVLQCPKPPIVTKGSQLNAFLEAWAQCCSKPLVLFFDEIDSLFDKSLMSVLHQLRNGFSYRPQNFPHSIILCGLRDVRDYKITSGSSPSLGTVSPFNIKSDSLTLPCFTTAEVATLYLQHTTATGQQFETGALAKAWELTAGQPWLVNALANEVVGKMKVPVGEIITVAHIEQAAQRLIIARATHLDSLVAKLHEERVRNVIEPILAGSIFMPDVTYDDDISFVRDLGLITDKAPLNIANPIYREVIVRVLASRASDSILFERPSFVDAQGLLNVGVILSEFALWWAENAEAMLKGHVYHEVAAQVVFMAWLQRVVNGGGIIDREYGIGRGRIDILIRWPHPTVQTPRQWQREAFELKVWIQGKRDPLQQGLIQLERYLDGLNMTSGTLVIFDRRPDAAPAPERTNISQTTTPKGYAVRLLRA